MSFAAESMERLKLAHDRLHEVIGERDELLEALIGVVRVADRATDEFDAARAAIAKATGAARGESNA